MERHDDDAPFPREPWQRLLGESGDRPPVTTDARIRAAARRALAPRSRRWWLPASLAASVVLAVFIVKSQLGTVRVPVVTESDGPGGTIHARIIDREEADPPRQAGEAPAARSKRAAVAKESKPDEDAFGYQDSGLAADSAGAGPMIGGPERDLQVATGIPEEAMARELPAAPPPAAAPAASAPLEARARIAAPDVERLRREALPHSATPESWYAEIERLRAAGEVEEADRQLEQLKIVFPGWLEQQDGSPEGQERR
jgi:hypothetical protein